MRRPRSRSPRPQSHRLVVFVVALAAAAACLGIGPCGPIPGGAIPETTAMHPVIDWSFANSVPHCVVEVQPDAPYSVTVNCMSFDGSLFVSCSSCEGKRWSGIALKDPRGRVQVGERIYPVRLSRVVDVDRLDAVWRARATKLGEDEQTPRKAGWWTFELTSR